MGLKIYLGICKKRQTHKGTRKRRRTMGDDRREHSGSLPTATTKKLREHWKGWWEPEERHSWEISIVVEEVKAGCYRNG